MALSPGAVVCPTNLPLLFPIRMRGSPKPWKSYSLHLCEEEDPHATNHGLWKTQRCTTQTPLPEKNTSQLHESGLCTAPAISFFKVASAVQLGFPILGITPGKCLSNRKLRAHSSWKDPSQWLSRRRTLLLTIPPSSPFSSSSSPSSPFLSPLLLFLLTT